MAIDTFPWFALRVKSQREAIAAAVLEGQGYRPLHPTYAVRRRWSDRLKVLQMPLFPGYLFCQLNLANPVRVVTMPSILGIVNSAGRSLAIPDHEIEALRRLIDSGVASRPWPYLHAGQDVRVQRGPLEGLEGRIVNFKGVWRVVVSITLLQRSVAAEIDREWVRPIRSAIPTVPRFSMADCGALSA